MVKLASFGEDLAHKTIVGSLVRRVATDFGVKVELDWRVAWRGHGMVVNELIRYLKDLDAQPGEKPDLILVSTDANCQGYKTRIRKLQRLRVPTPKIYAVPDPHIERWLLLDSSAFKNALGHGCDAPDLKCDRGRYKHLLRNALSLAKAEPQIGGMEYAENIVGQMDIDRTAAADQSFRKFIESLRRNLRSWRA